MMAESMGGIVPTYDVNCNNRGNDGFGDGGWGVWVIFLFFIMAFWGNGSWGGFGGNNGLQGSLTRADLCQDMNFQQMENGIRGIQQGLCDGFYAQNSTMLNGFNGLQNSICQATAGIESSLCNGFNNVNNNITQSRFDAQQCCCETNRNIDSVRYENARNTCDIVNAIREDGALTRAQMTANEMQNLRDQLNTANLQLSQQAQSANLINQLRPCPIPAYLSCSPYTSYDPFGNAYGRNGYGYGYSGCSGCGNGCGCGN